MRFSELFTKTRKQFPKDEISRNAQLLIKAGYVDKLSAGIYTFLPLGLRVLKKIENIIRKEMNALGGEEILMPSLHPKELWEETGRLQTYGPYRVSDTQGKEFVLGPTHEEVVTPLMKEFILSYKDLPRAVYQFQNKFRQELRAKSGLLRGREFIMKDLYSFHATENDLDAYYEKVKQSYKNIFDRVEIGHITYETFASGGTFSQFSHEFQTLTPAGEDTIYLCDSCSVAVNQEIIETQAKCPQCGKPREELKEAKSIEVGNIFPLKTKFSDAFRFTVKDEAGKEIKVLMGCYGIGISRLMGATVEVLSDERGLMWPKSIAPFDFHVIALGGSESFSEAGTVAQQLEGKGFEVLYDDRTESAGIKLSDAELMGIPYTLIMSDRTREQQKIEIKDRKTGKAILEDLGVILRKPYGAYFG